MERNTDERISVLYSNANNRGCSMTWFLFVGDMLVMFFMCSLVVWVFMKSTAESAEAAARIPLEDEYTDE